MMSFNRFFIVLLATLVLAITACGGAATAVPASTPASVAPSPTTQQSSGATTIEARRSSTSEEITLRVGTGFLTAIVPPVRHTAVAMGLGETLFRLGDEYRPVPWLATEAKNLDEKTWEITLRQGVKFHNGVEMDAAAVKASLERAFAESASIKGLLDTARTDVKDAYTLTIVTNRPSPILPSLLTAGRTAIVEVGAAQAMGDAFNEKPVLTGPFKVERFQQGKELVAVRHEDYWGPRPLVDRLVVTHIPDNNSLVLALEAGDIDIARGIPPHSVEPVEAHPDLVVRQPAQFQLNFMFLNGFVA